MNKNQRKWLVISIVITIIMALGLGLGLGLGLKKKGTHDYFNENFTNIGINLSEKQLKFKKALEDFDKLLKCKIDYFLFAGTALGAHREKKFIEHDEDIDLAVFGKDMNIINKDLINYIKNTKIFKIINLLPLNCKNLDNITEIQMIHISTNVRVDIMILENNPLNNDYLHYSYFGKCNIYPDKRCTFDIKNFTPIEIIFLGNKYKIPPKSYLVNYYGDDWHIEKKFGYLEGINKHYYKALRK